MLPPGAANVGELWVRGPQVMQGYLNNAAADAATLRDGWLMTGDVAWADEAGNFYIVDRRKELIKKAKVIMKKDTLDQVAAFNNEVAEVKGLAREGGDSDSLTLRKGPYFLAKFRRDAETDVGGSEVVARQ